MEDLVMNNMNDDDNAEGERLKEDGVQDRVAHVRDLALVLFDRTKTFHELGKNSRQVMELSALFHLTPLPESKKKPERAVRKALKPLLSSVDINSGDRAVLMAVLAHHKGLIKRKTIGSLDLSPIQQRATLTIAALLRIAVGLDDSGSHKTEIKQVELERDNMWIVVEGPRASGDAVVAQHNARLWEKIGYPKVKILEPAEAEFKLFSYPDMVNFVGMQPSDSMAEAGRKVMRHQFSEMFRNEGGTRSGDSMVSLHDMRVAVRRLRAAFRVFGDAFERGALKPYLKGLKETGRALGRVRDIDVFIEKIQKYQDTLPEEKRVGLNLVLQTWREKRELARSKMLAYLDGQDYSKFKQKFYVFLSTPGAGARKISKDHPVAYRIVDLAPSLIYERMAAVRAFEPFLEDAPIELLHALRIEFKMLRYTIEYFQEILGPTTNDLINELKTIQDHLGDLNDANVAIQLMNKYLDGWNASQASLPVEERQNMEEIASYLAARDDERRHLKVSFQDAWGHFIRPEFKEKLALAIAVL